MAPRIVVITRVLLLTLLVLFSLTPSCPGAPANPATAEFERANKLYEQARYAEAAAAYDNLIKGGTPSPAAWFNLGNAQYKAGQVGGAIAAYRMAERQKPRDSSLRANLQFVRAKVYTDERARVPVWKNMIRVATPNEWAVLAAAGFWSLFVLLIWAQAKGSSCPRMTFLLTLSVIFFGTCLGLALNDHATPQAVVTVREATARRGPLEESQSAFQLGDGAEVTVTAIKGDWIEVRDLEKRTGWVRRDALALLPTQPLVQRDRSVAGPLG